MILALLAVAALGYWLHTRGELIPALRRWGAVAALGVLAVAMFKSGNLIFTVIAAAAAAMWWFGAQARTREVGSETEARKLLGLSEDADAADVHAAWRRTLATVHPDKGGSSAAAARATAARDLLLERLQRR